ncbi:extracellular solute-binding protein [Gracilibacillus alcaliphilus]|uniref:extracellular solute-binding protein n=1 Tax=Gracilibacillus alcaliphilus TaxID=1401441 RepID=UPI00195B6D04|nr:extracellular solute-binding protein [Gracilibacillus alcaliphilus]MBM7676283.1 putative aldouronate transport system substrate-binding protein [Gracilibacillus alcaliphilus]
MTKKVYYLLFSLVLCSVLAACNSNTSSESDQQESGSSESAANVNKEGFPIVDEEITLSMIAPGTGMEDWDKMETLQEYSEMTNIHFNYDTPPMADFQTKLNLAFASGDIADIIFAAGSTDFTPGMEVDYGQQGVLVPLEDLIAEYAPNIQKMLDDNPDIAKSITTVDGHIYSLPRVSQGDFGAVWYRGPMWYNGKWLDELGVEELPKTIDEFYDLLVRFRDEDPNGNGEADEIPLIDVQMNSTRLWLLAAFGLKEWGIDEVDGEVRYTPITENYKEYLTFMNKLYDEKLLDQETFAQSDEQKKAKGQDNRVGVFPDYFSYFTTGETEEEAMNNPMFHPLTSEWSEEPVLPLNPGISRATFSITNNNEHPEASIRWIDYFYSEEGHQFLNMGPEGVMWEYGDNGEIIEFDTPSEFDSSEDWRGTITPDYGISTPTLSQPIEGKEVTEFTEFVQEETDEKYTPYGEVPFPLVYLTQEEQEELNAIAVDLQSYVEQAEAKFITGVEPMSNWDAYVTTIENMNVERYIEIYQAAYDRWAES